MNLFFFSRVIILIGKIYELGSYYGSSSLPHPKFKQIK